ncbi:MAG TPA: hypothetical protein PKA77_17100 [Chitinophagaceae bacterium]|jgi:hypothetical protein|nr:hypothetical protein [Chitinophagaceae bacterium]
MNTTPGKSLNPDKFKDNELKAVHHFLQSCTATATEVAVALSIHRPNLCRYKRFWEKQGELAEVKKGRCPVTKHLAAFLTTNKALFPGTLQLSIFDAGEGKRYE